MGFSLRLRAGRELGRLGRSGCVEEWKLDGVCVMRCVEGHLQVAMVSDQVAYLSGSYC